MFPGFQISAVLHGDTIVFEPSPKSFEVHSCTYCTMGSPKDYYVYMYNHKYMYMYNYAYPMYMYMYVAILLLLQL